MRFDVAKALAAVFAKFTAIFERISFGPNATLVMTTILVVVAFGRLVWLWSDEKANLGQFLKLHTQTLVLWGLIPMAPYLTSSLGAFASGRAKAALAADGALITSAQGAMNSGVDAVVATWALRAPVQERLSREFGWATEDANAPDTLDNFTNARNRLFEQTRARRRALNEAKKAAKAGMRSTDPVTKSRSILAASDAEQGLRELETIEAQWKAAEKPAREANQRIIDGQSPSGRNMFQHAVSAALTFTVSGWDTLYQALKGAAVVVLAALAVVPAIFLAASAVLGILSALVATLGRLLVYACGVTIASSMGMTISPLAVLSFASQSWSRYGWQFVGFWLQVLVSAVAIGPIVAMGGAALAILAGWASSAATGMQAAALPCTTAWETFIALTLGALPLMALKLLAGQIPALIEKALTAVIGPISGHFQP